MQSRKIFLRALNDKNILYYPFQFSSLIVLTINTVATRQGILVFFINQLTNMKEAVTFSISTYTGCEEEILFLRNKNRLDKRTRAYMDWRYMTFNTMTAPAIFWVNAPDGSRVGMAALIFRHYWVDNKKYEFAVLGDISLNQELRGTGIGKNLFQFINLYLEKKCRSCGFVIPNVSAQRSLSSAGWIVKEKLIPFVFVLNPEENIFKLIKNRIIANLLAIFFRKLNYIILSLYKSKHLKSLMADTFDQDFEKIWRSVSKKNIILRDKRITALDWRYGKYQTEKYYIKKFILKNQFIGYIIYKIQNMRCIIYDFLSLRDKYVRPILILFIFDLLKQRNINILRITLNENHPYIKMLKKTGFIKRNNEGVFQVYLPSSSNNLLNNYTWIITAGDKDI